MELTIPQVGNWLSANDREHPLARARRVKEWRTAKAIMDGLRDAGVLPEDDTTHIPVVTFRSAVGPPSVDVIMERC